MALEIKGKNIRTSFALIVAVSGFFFGMAHARAATMQVNSNSTTLSQGDILTLSVSLNSEGVAINNAEAKIILPSDLLEVVSLNKSSSIFTLWVEEPSYSNSTGIVTFNGGIPTPGFTGSDGTAISIVAKAKKAGKANIIISEAAVRANDGLGTNVLDATRGNTILVVAKTEASAPNLQTSVQALLAITSPTHPSQELWYKDNNPLFRWKVPIDADAIQTGIDAQISGSPRVTYSPPISEKSVSELKDGTWYFKVRARKNGQWGPVSTYIARIDKTVPKKNSISFDYDNQSKVLHIRADVVDETSGIDYYNLYINNVLAKKIAPTDFTEGLYDFEVTTFGDVSAKLVAVDRAGNTIDEVTTFRATPAIKDASLPNESNIVTDGRIYVSMGSFHLPLLHFVILSVSILILLLIGAFTLGGHYNLSAHRMKLRPSLGKEHDARILMSLKRRLEKHLDLLQQLRHTRVLSKEEKEVKKSIEDDLDEIDKMISG